MRFAALFLAFAVLSVPAALAEPRTRAVLVGVGDYLTLDADLQGPPNDVALMAGMLLRRGVAADDIRALTDPGTTLPGGLTVTAPDRAAILNSFAQTIAASAPGDTVLFYFSGHGTQAPDQDGDEQGGYDELFLPRDAGAWNGSVGEVENAIRDDDLAALVQFAADRGVLLVGLIDACHSATGFRALDDSAGRARYVEPGRLGIPETDAGTDAAATAQLQPPEGQYVFLYAAQSNQRAFEYRLEDDQWYGDFTRNLVNILQEVPALSYDQLAQATTLRLRTRSGQVAQTPEIEGPLASAPVFGGNAPGVRRLTVQGTVLQAGALQDITPGSQLDLYADPLSGTPIGTARVTQVRGADAELEFLAPLPTQRVTHAELTRRALDVSFAVTLTQGAGAALERLVPGGAAQLAQATDATIRDTAEHAIVWAGDSFALIGRDGVLDAAGPGTSPRLLRPADSADPVADLAMALDRHARRARLEQALAQLAQGGQTGFSLLSSGPQIQFARLPGTRKGGRCRLSGDSEPAGAKAQNCDGIEITVTNSTTRMQDVTVLYLDADAGISLLWPQNNLSNRIPSGEERAIRIGLRNETDSGLSESVLVLSLPAEPGSPRVVLDGLAGGTARGDGGAMSAWLAALSDPASTNRTLSLTPPGGDLNMSRLDLVISPDL